MKRLGTAAAVSLLALLFGIPIVHAHPGRRGHAVRPSPAADGSSEQSASANPEPSDAPLDIRPHKDRAARRAERRAVRSARPAPAPKAVAQLSVTRKAPDKSDAAKSDDGKPDDGKPDDGKTDAKPAEIVVAKTVNTRVPTGRTISAKVTGSRGTIAKSSAVKSIAAKDTAETVVAKTSEGPVDEAFAAKAETAPPAEDKTNIVEVLNVPLGDLIAKHALANGVPVRLAAAVVRIESNYQARIVHAGNYGLMQIRAQTARSLGFLGPIATLVDPDTNLRFGMKYLGEAYKLAKGDVCRTVMRYQSGFGTTRLSAANRAYCAKAMQMMAHT